VAAERAHCARSTVYEAVNALEAAGENEHSRLLTGPLSGRLTVPEKVSRHRADRDW